MAKPTTIEQRRLFNEEVKEALAAASAAGLDAFEALKRSRSELVDPQGRIRAELGSTLLYVRRPSHRLRTALKELGEIDTPDRPLGWSIRSLPPDVVGQAVMGQLAACEAAAKVLTERFPGEGNFSCPTRDT